MARRHKHVSALVIALVAGLAALAIPAEAVEKRELPAELTACINEGVPDQFTTYNDFATKVPVR
jgi:hypothetical protein